MKEYNLLKILLWKVKNQMIEETKQKEGRNSRREVEEIIRPQIHEMNKIQNTQEMK